MPGPTSSNDGSLAGDLFVRALVRRVALRIADEASLPARTIDPETGAVVPAFASSRFNATSASGGPYCRGCCTLDLSCPCACLLTQALVSVASCFVGNKASSQGTQHASRQRLLSSEGHLRPCAGEREVQRSLNSPFEVLQAALQAFLPEMPVQRRSPGWHASPGRLPMQDERRASD